MLKKLAGDRLLSRDSSIDIDRLEYDVIVVFVLKIFTSCC